MVFRAYIVKKNTSKSIRVAGIGLGFVSLALAMYGFELLIDLAVFVLLAGFVLLIVGVVAGGGKDFYLYTKEILSVSPNEITIAGTPYPISTITSLVFYYHSFYSQSSYGYFYEHSGMIELGMNNSVSFTCNGQQLYTLFSIADIYHANSFFHVVRHMQATGIPLTLTVRTRIDDP